MKRKTPTLVKKPKYIQTDTTGSGQTIVRKKSGHINRSGMMTVIAVKAWLKDPNTMFTPQFLVDEAAKDGVEISTKDARSYCELKSGTGSTQLQKYPRFRNDLRLRHKAPKNHRSKWLYSFNPEGRISHREALLYHNTDVVKMAKFVTQYSTGGVPKQTKKF